MIFAILTLLTALALAAVAGWFSIIGLMAILAGQPVAALVLGITLEAGKLVTTSWLYRNWKEAGWGLKAPLIYFTLALMVATSMGVFGFLSKAHLEQGASTMDNSSKIARMEQQITREKSLIADNDKVTAQLDATVNSFLGKDRADRALSVRKSQANQRKQLKDDSDAAQKRIESINDEKFKLESELRQLQLEVGPIRYIAELIYGSENSSNKTLESAVRIFTLIIVSTLDPLAITLLIAANFTILRIQNEKKEKSRTERENISGEQNTTSDDSEQKTNSGGTHPSEETFIDPGTSFNSILTGNNVQSNTEAQIYVPIPAEIVEKISEEETIVLPQESAATAERPIAIRVEDGEDTDWEVPYTPETEEVALSEEEKATMASWLLRGKNYAGVRQPSPTQVVSNPTTEQETSTDISPTSGTDEAIAALPLEISSRKSVVMPWAQQESVLRELIGAPQHFEPQKINEEEIKEELLPHTEETHSQENSSIGETQPEISLDGEIEKSTVAEVAVQELDNASEQVVQTHKYPKALSWLNEFRRD